MKQSYAVLRGSFNGGFNLTGPFSDRETAERFCEEERIEGGAASVVVLHKPRPSATGYFHELTTAERDVVLAGLRLWQRVGNFTLPEWDIACNMEAEPLDNAAIDALCERLND